ncbi:transglutaminase domain-containing protein [Desulfobulbus sp. TB]|nr:transglutaminase domain-containing protein [Desulfobulbus sp. TB]
MKRLTIPPFLSSAILLFWGWQTGLLLLALPMALVLEGSRYVKTKWDLSQDDFNRITDICTILLAGLAVFLLTTDARRVAIQVLQWLPVICFPLITAQQYSVAGKIDIRALMILARNKAVAADNRPRTINASAPYAALCLIAAGTGNVKDGSFFLGLLFLAAWGFWPQRSQRFSPLVWIMLFALVAGTGYAGQLGLYHLQKVAIRMVSHWWFTRDSDPFNRSTSMGDIGEMKLSSRIVFRVTSEEEPFRPVLLREASYNLYRNTTWRSSPVHFTDVSPETDKTTWNLHPDMYADSEPGKFFTVWVPLKRNKALLKLPQGTYQLQNLPVSRLQKSPLSAFKVEEGPGLIGYQVHYQAESIGDLPPTQEDLIVPPEELDAIQHIIEELQLSSQKKEDVPKILDDFFQDSFEYSLKLRAAGQNKTSLANFLLSSRAGHCEYFATATVLLLRASGIPARYTTGWSAHESSTFTDQIVVRARHAHAWTQFYLNGLWYSLDTTSSTWREQEDQADSDMVSLRDLWDALLFKFSQWRWGMDKEMLKKWWWVLLIPLAIIIIRKMRANRKIRRVKTENTGKGKQRQGKDSPFERIEQRLKELGFVRSPWEPPLSWVQRMQTLPSQGIFSETMISCLLLYYQGRFSQDGLTTDRQTELEDKIALVLEELEQKGKETPLSPTSEQV